MIRLKIYTNASTFLHSSLALCTYSIFAKRFTSTCITANATIGVIEEQIDQFSIARCLYADIPIAGGIRILLCRGDDIRLSIIVVFRASSVIKCVDKRLVGFIFVQTTQCLGCLVLCICTICSHSIDDDSVPDLLAQQSRRLSFSSGRSACASLIVSIFFTNGRQSFDTAPQCTIRFDDKALFFVLWLCHWRLRSSSIGIVVRCVAVFCLFIANIRIIVEAQHDQIPKAGWFACLELAIVFDWSASEPIFGKRFRKRAGTIVRYSRLLSDRRLSRFSIRLDVEILHQTIVNTRIPIPIVARRRAQGQTTRHEYTKASL